MTKYEVVFMDKSGSVFTHTIVLWNPSVKLDDVLQELELECGLRCLLVVKLSAE